MLGVCASARIISAFQTRVDGVVPSTRHSYFRGSTFHWFGTPMRLDGARDALCLDGVIGEVDLQSHVSKSVAKLRRARKARPALVPAFDEDRTDTLIVSDGTTRWHAGMIETQSGDFLLSFESGLPPYLTELVIEQAPHFAPPSHGHQTICFTPGTLIDTPDGPFPVDVLYPGDRVLTRDDGPQEILWMGLRQISGARLYAQPDLRPIRLRAGVFGSDSPEPDLVVSPGHRILLTEPRLQALWQTDEALVRARDLVDDRRVLRDHQATEATYVHILLANHQVVRANGLWVESFHPDDADLSHLNVVDRAELEEISPMGAYGPHARRCLSQAELAILRHEGGPRYLA